MTKTVPQFGRPPEADPEPGIKAHVCDQLGVEGAGNTARYKKRPQKMHFVMLADRGV